MTLWTYVCQNVDCTGFRKPWGTTTESRYCAMCGLGYTDPPTRHDAPPASADPMDVIDGQLAKFETDPKEKKKVAKTLNTALALLLSIFHDPEVKGKLENLQFVARGFTTEPGPSKQTMWEEIQKIRKELRTLSEQNALVYKEVKKLAQPRSPT